MGLTIHYDLRADGRLNEDKIKSKLGEVRRLALDLPVEEVSELAVFTAKDLPDDRPDPDDPWGWAKVQCGVGVYFGPGKGWRRSCVHVPPTLAVMFRVWPGKECEEANFGLCKYPKTVTVDGNILPTRVSGWSWHSFCKTQYSNEKGIEHFLRCHLSVIRLLDKCQEVGILGKVKDEGNYWDKRDPRDLTKEIGEWDAMIAAFGGAFKDSLPTGFSLEAPIFNRPDFEKLETAGCKDEKTRKTLELIRATARKS